MTGLLARLSGFFYEPASSRRADTSPPGYVAAPAASAVRVRRLCGDVVPPAAPAGAVAGGDVLEAAAPAGAVAGGDGVPVAPPVVAVLAAAEDAMAAAAAIGLGLARRRRAPAVLVCVWRDGGEPAAAWHASASPAARRLATSLAARGHDAHGRGRLVVVRLEDAEESAVAGARRAGAAAAGAPTVLALGRPRGLPFDRVLAAHDLVVVATRAQDGGVARLAVSRLHPAAAVARYEVPAALTPRLLAAGGFGLPRSLRAAVDDALRGLP